MNDLLLNTPNCKIFRMIQHPLLEEESKHIITTIVNTDSDTLLSLSTAHIHWDSKGGAAAFALFLTAIANLAFDSTFYGWIVSYTITTPITCFFMWLHAENHKKVCKRLTNILSDIQDTLKNDIENQDEYLAIVIKHSKDIEYFLKISDKSGELSKVLEVILLTVS